MLGSWKQIIVYLVYRKHQKPFLPPITFSWSNCCWQNYSCLLLISSVRDKCLKRFDVLIVSEPIKIVSASRGFHYSWRKFKQKLTYIQNKDENKHWWAVQVAANIALGGSPQKYTQIDKLLTAISDLNPLEIETHIYMWVAYS